MGQKRRLEDAEVAQAEDTSCKHARIDSSTPYPGRDVNAKRRETGHKSDPIQIQTSFQGASTPYPGRDVSAKRMETGHKSDPMQIQTSSQGASSVVPPSTPLCRTDLMPPPFPDPKFAKAVLSSDYGSFPEETQSSQYGSFPVLSSPRMSNRPLPLPQHRHEVSSSLPCLPQQGWARESQGVLCADTGPYLTSLLADYEHVKEPDPTYIPTTCSTSSASGNNFATPYTMWRIMWCLRSHVLHKDKAPTTRTSHSSPKSTHLGRRLRFVLACDLKPYIFRPLHLI